MEMMTCTENIISSDSVAPSTKQKSKHAVLLLHGLGGGPEEMYYLKRKLMLQGFHVEVPLLPGHCTHYLDLKKIKWQEYAEVAYAEFEKLKREHETVSVSGLCLGAVLALAVGIKYGDQVHAICPISTTLNFDGWGLPFITKLIWLAPFTPFYHFYNLSESDPYGIKDEKLRNFIKKKMSDTSKTHYAKVPFKSIWEMRKLNFYVKENMHKVTSEICAIHPLEDDVSSVRSVEDIKKRVKSQRFEALILKDSYHLATIDRERDLVANTICNFIGNKNIIGMA